MAFDPSTTPAHTPGLAVLAKEFETLDEAMKALKTNHERVRQQIIALVSEEPGEYTLTEGTTAVTVTRSEKWDWDHDVLEAMFASSSMPDYVEQRLTVKKKEFEKLSETEKKALLPALTRGPGTVRIKVSTRGAS